MTSTAARAPRIDRSARVGGEHAPHAGWIVDREHPGDEAARRAAHDDERDARRRHDLAVGPRHDFGLLVTRVVAARAHRASRGGHRDARPEWGGTVERHAE